jgi:GPH family glycoside/pentoside/hexuronide:cation symporter
MSSALAPLSSPSVSPKVVSRPQLPLLVKLSYGVGDLAVAIRLTAVRDFLLFFYTNVVMLNPSLAGLALAIGRLWDGVNDPLVGYLSDSTTSRFGRRRLYLLVSVLPLGVCFYLLWSPPLGLGAMGNFVFLAIMYMLMDACFTLYATPYLALGAELSQDYHERTQIVATRTVFHGLGAFIAVTCLSKVVGGSPTMLPDSAAALSSTLPPTGARQGFAQVGALLAGVMIFAGLIAFYGSRETPPSSQTVQLSFRSFINALRSTLDTQPFRVLIYTFAVMTLGASIHQPLTVYVFRDWLAMGQQLPTLMTLYLAAVLLSLGSWTHLARRIGKNRAFQVCILWSVAALSVFPVLRADMPSWVFYMFLILAGFGAGGYILPLSIAADVVDYDELHSGQRREGAFFGLWTLTMKLMAVGILLVGMSLDLIGYMPNQAQSPFTLWSLKILYGPIPALFFLASFFIFLRFPLTREHHADIQQQLQLRRLQLSAHRERE